MGFCRVFFSVVLGVSEGVFWGISHFVCWGGIFASRGLPTALCRKNSRTMRKTCAEVLSGPLSHLSLLETTFPSSPRLSAPDPKTRPSRLRPTSERTTSERRPKHIRTISETMAELKGKVVSSTSPQIACKLCEHNFHATIAQKMGLLVPYTQFSTIF